MEPILPTALLALVVFNLTNLARFVAGRDWNGVVTNGLTWLVGWIVALVASASTILEGVVLPGFSQSLGQMSAVDLILVGIPLGSFAHTTAEFKSAFDNASSAAKPHLLESQRRIQDQNAINNVSRVAGD